MYNKSRRYFLIQSTAMVAAVGVAGAAVPFVSAMNPSARARALGGPIKVDVSRLEPGEMLVAEWRRQPVYIVCRTERMIKSLEAKNPNLSDENSESNQQPEYARNALRSRDPEFFVVQGICTHLGCAPKEVSAVVGDAHIPNGGFVCPCHDSRFDLAGRVVSGFPAGDNLKVPPHYFDGPGMLVVGLDSAAV